MKIKERLIKHFDSLDVCLNERELTIAEIGYLLHEKDVNVGEGVA